MVRQLKEAGAPEVDIKKEINELKARKKLLEERELALAPKDISLDRTKLEALLKQRFFYDISFSIYGGVSGQYDFGPMGCAVKTNLLSAWRNHFVLEEQLLEVDCTILTPESVLKASGHVDRFADVMVKDLENGQCFRLDHLIKGQFEKMMTDKKLSVELRKEMEDILTRLDGYSRDEMNAVMRKYDMKSPVTGNNLSDAMDFNLMFSTEIGPAGGIKAFLRPETAQGIFVNFKRLLEFNAGKLPFGVAQVGNAFRNEISPRSGLIRVREFTMAEIEYFLDPEDKDHSKFDEVKDVELNLFSACNQMDGKSAEMVNVGKAVAEKLIANQTLAYFMVRIHQFMVKVGIDPNRLRFRQHMSNEMAHYACDCWDAECLTSYGWIECVGCADRSAYDLTQHTNATGVRLSAERKLDKPKEIQVSEVVPNKAVAGKIFKKDINVVTSALQAMTVEERNNLAKVTNDGGEYSLKIEDKEFKLTKDVITFKEFTKVTDVEEVIPSVIEPSFGIGRIMYSMWEHSYRTREGDDMRNYLSLPPVIAPYKCSILPIYSKPDFVPFIRNLSKQLTKHDVSHKVDDSSGSIGRRYARTDEISIPFGITIDFDTLKDDTATLRERDSMTQIRAPLAELPILVKELSDGKKTWEGVCSVYPRFEAGK